MLIVLARLDGGVIATRLDDDGTVLGEQTVDDLAAFVASEEAAHPRWVWDDTSRWYPPLLAARVRVERCFDLRLCHAILRSSALTADSALATAPLGPWDAPAAATHEPERDDALFALDEAPPAPEPDPLAEYLSQRDAVAAAAEPARIGRLLAAESAGALISVEMRFAGLPWSAEAHDRILTGILGARPAAGRRPERMQEQLDRIRAALDTPDLNPDSAQTLLGALRRAGLRVKSTAKWELRELDHPVIEPLLAYKKLARLLSANGWHWLETWVVDGRFRPEYVPGGVVTGRWATSGGGALQLPRQVRGAVIADPGWKLVVADAAQLEPRILAAMAGDRGMVEAGAAGDLYAGIVASGAVETRDEAKIALLGAMYGATTGDSGRLLPRLARTYPKAIGLVEEAARAGERGEIVTTRLGRSSPTPGSGWQQSQSLAYDETATEADTSRARSRARAWGRFTRNFIVQGTAAEWALCWMASLRRRLTDLAPDAWLTDAPHLVFFLHDEVVVHTPAELADEVAAALAAAAEEAGRLLFGELPVAFPLSIAVVDDYGQAK
ncbi:bifunctional 3'-5' exonuclease/DNA polymerase [Leifsonia sp. H3M29-4]|uniref:bifunctional 3'-5' exonuclease/DNA polymerase n=1 Tax=Salinibacterium metalliresistens TaxID=3031321 RepID=UPI0023D9AB99|nr:bifunctional 3'-5' exonuclease/DNA polymerase [Salinibacterium metalliresistens]MDF1480230.1 bifunctional 3'-5' exonuclease/DNA polymerase [Salinibacterium metalliresistens]